MDDLIKKLDKYIKEQSAELINLYQDADNYRKLRYEGMLDVLDEINCIIHPENIAFTFECDCTIEEGCNKEQAKKESENYEIKTTHIDSATTILTCYRPNEQKKKKIEDDGFKLKSINNGIFTYSKDGGSIITVVPKNNKEGK